MRWYKINEDKTVTLLPPGEFPDYSQHSTAHRRVGDDTVDGQRVSTVFLEMDHNWEPAGSPILFETMIFGGPYDTDMWRYSTYDEAKLGHDRIVNCLKAGANPNKE
jgi:hypothetical protein